MDPYIGDVTKVSTSWDGKKVSGTSISYSCMKGEVFTVLGNNTVNGSCKFKAEGEVEWDYTVDKPLKECTGRINLAL